MIVLSCNNICKSFGIDVILNNISFSINKGEKVGLVGVNGAGKSTLFKILTNQLSYDTGELFISKSTTIGHLEQNTILNENSSIMEECLSIFQHLIDMEQNLRSLEIDIANLSNNEEQSHYLDEAMHKYSILLEEFNEKNGYGFRSEIKGVLKGLGFLDEEFEQPIYQLSGGQKTRVALAKLLLTHPDLLLLDEPTNHLDIEAVEWLEGFLRDYDGTILMISHDRYFLDQMVNRIFEIENHSLTSYNGNFSIFMEKKRILIEQQIKEYIEQQKELDRQKDIVRRLRQHGTEKLMNRAKSREKQLEKIEQMEAPIVYRNKAFIRFEAQVKSGNDVLSLQNVSKSFNNNMLFENVAFDIYKGEKVALIGPNGIGKSTLFKIILDEVKANSGNIRLGHNVFTGYYDQEQKNLNYNKTTLDEIWDDHINLNQTEVRTLLGSFLFKGDDVFKMVESLSGGEKGRLSLLKLILSRSNLLLLDEPTNHLDIDSKEVLEEALINYDGTVFVISHDRYFLNRVATKIIELSPNGNETYLGNYDYYIQKKKEKLSMNEPEAKEEKTKTQLKEEKRKEREERENLRAIAKTQKKLEAEISELEEKIKELEELMCQEEIYSNEEKSKEVHQETQQLKERLELLYSQWEDIIDM
ncbi:ABC-F family ATP-binding cassette domain-containing protein [Alkaliphilus sp. MSJ-5]|uniref:ABC-F family ATP-binding cassette domain-containing protein n=1 Tax=Alkaliphilus flagellatus TaxID=2841507 RepID=A0ABS6G535_9FIRM|nr:ABC-F family ATP-binding cassette domain-containing protein [Alkaliphilus flagellatus]MBU5676723.1 ABC-F family ATP-binding cassette domain-containing protein [Alkaliphilus flagellatus]